MDVDFKCFEPEPYDYYGIDTECIAQWIAFDDWCWNDPTHDEFKCKQVNQEFADEMARRLLVLLGESEVVEDESSSFQFAKGLALGAGVASAVIALMAIRKCSSKNKEDFTRA